MARFEGAGEKLRRAREHFEGLKAEIADFTSRRPFEIYEEADDDGGRLFKVRVNEQPPIRWSTILGDVVHNLRSALDLAACDLVGKGGGKVTTNTGFPIANGAKELKAHLPNRLKGAAQKVRNEVEALQPYKGGAGHDLWLLHQLDIADKHHLLFTVGAAYRAFVFKPVLPMLKERGVEFPGIALRPADSLYPIQDGETLLKFNPGTEGAAEDNPEFRFDVAFGGGTVIDGEPIPEVVDRIGGAVDRALGTLRPYA